MGDAALDAAGFGFVAPIWDMFFPQSQPVFSQQQLAQLEILMTEALGEQSYQNYFDLFIAITSDLHIYINNPSSGGLDNIVQQSVLAMEGISNNGYSTTSTYIAAAALNILALRLSFDVASNSDKRGAAKNIGDAALAALETLVQLEEDYLNATSFYDFSVFKQAVSFQNGSMTPAVVAAFGGDYALQIQKLLWIVCQYAPNGLSKVRRPPFRMLFAPYDENSTPCTWQCQAGQSGTGISIYKCQTLPPGIPSNYFPLADLASPMVNWGDPPQFTDVAYISSNAEFLTAPNAYAEQYNDHGSGLPLSYAGYWTIPRGIGSFSSSSDDSTEPDNADFIRLIPSQYYSEMQLSSEAWDDQGSGASDNGEIYLHPQFGNYGVYVIVGSHSRPTPDTVPGLSYSALSGIEYMFTILNVMDITTTVELEKGEDKFVLVLQNFSETPVDAKECFWVINTVHPEIFAMDERSGTLTISAPVYELAANDYTFAVYMQDSEGEIFACPCLFQISFSMGYATYTITPYIDSPI